MILLVEFEVLPEKKYTVRSNYRPTWRSERKPEHNDAPVYLPREVESVPPGGRCTALLRPMCPELWVVDAGDVLRGYEGFRELCRATVVRVFD